MSSFLSLHFATCLYYLCISANLLATRELYSWNFCLWCYWWFQSCACGCMCFLLHVKKARLLMQKCKWLGFLFSWSLTAPSRQAIYNLHGLSYEEKVSRLRIRPIPYNGTCLSVSQWKLRMVLMVGYRSSCLNQNKPFSGSVSTLLSSSAELYSFTLSCRLRHVGLIALTWCWFLSSIYCNDILFLNIYM